jgi:hypothetical protein
MTISSGNHGEIMGKSWGNHGGIHGKCLWDDDFMGEIMGNPWECLWDDDFMGEIMGRGMHEESMWNA